MGTNRFKEALEQRRTPLMAWMWSSSVVFAEIICDAGFDAIGFDLQHSALAFNDLDALIAVVSARGVTPVVRIAHPDDLGSVTRVLDSGARGVICPNCDSAEQARAFAAAAKYPPLGTRGFGPVRPGIGRTVGYAAGGKSYSLEDENDSVLAIVQIESATGLANVEEILATPGVDSVFPGPMDLSLSLYGELVVDLSDSRQREPMERIIEVAHAAGKTVGLPPLAPERIPLLRDMGADWLQFGNDVAWVGIAATQTVATARDLMTQDSSSRRSP